ncbi:DUF2780 domain-containing protein [Photobacterium ganghwense]|uniref:DUF2780 domain-containing protein n=1 Tax=Photobacterium ganghwense TaxID=320778 RepID=A0A0J1GZ46_9GAMM|nr:DUF2780 domain-containing protein [Photobacterium ganghwense]KLV04901.1 hypothetical protein ABT57_23110 [Photobacterium ganghwense]MBV1840302.1 DUF2780 domain-containing protein [Photobacterium ganghwense]PSU04072.1 hypothetical protein C9I92_24570 [Photobacterium ganghwense]QSV13858.1 DUF2780 domain-containing protein [Photobacterium ganghwense]
MSATWSRRILVIGSLTGLLMMPATSSAFSLTDLFGSKTTEAVAENPLASLLSTQLGVTPEQAAGGAGALLSAATSQLSGSQATELAKMIPGAEALTGSLPPGIGALLGNMETINKIFAALGMDASMVSQFVPVVLQFLGNQGASAGLLQSLGNIWAPAAQ